MTARKAVWLVMRRELREGVRGRTFLVSTVLVVVLLGGVIAVTAVFGRKGTTQIGVAAPTPRLLQAIDSTARRLAVDVRIHRYANAAAARDAVEHRKVELALVDGGRRLYVRTDSSSTAIAGATAAAREALLRERADRAGVSVAQAQTVLAPPFTVATVPGAHTASSSDALIGILTMILLFIAVSLYGQAVLTSVVQEKASRIVEVLVATLRPRHLLAGKVAGIGLLGLAQLVLLGVVALVAALAGAIHLPTLGRAAPVALVCFLLGFALYAVAFAAAGALVSRVEDASAATAPVSMIMAACYVASFGSAASPDGAFATVMSLLPVSAPFTLPARAAQTAIPAWQYAASFVLMLAAIWGLIRVGGRVYELALLRTGPRVPFREALASARTRRGDYAAAAR